MTQSLLTRPDRVAALLRTALLDTPPEEAFDRLTRMAARLLGTPISLISLVTDDRQFFKSATGLPEPWASSRVSPISFSFCGQVVATGERLMLEDARRHPLLRHNPAIRELGWVAYAGVPLITPQGHTVGAFCVIDKTPRLWSDRDIALLQDLAASVVTEIELRSEIAGRRQAVAGLRASEDQFHSTFEESGIGMALISPDGRWLRVNHALSEMLGADPEELIGSSVEARTYPADAPAVREAIRLLLAGECRTYTMEKRYVRQSGEILWGLVNVSLVSGSEGAAAYFIAGIQDITERRRAEAESRERYERYRSLAEHAGEAVWEWDLLNDRVTWDEGAPPLLDYRRAESGDTASWWYERIHPSERERVVASLDTAIASGDTGWFEEYPFRRADGSYSVVEHRAHLAHDDSGTPVRVISAVADVSQRHRPGPRLQQVLDTLPSAIWVVDRQGRVLVANSSSRQIWGSIGDVGAGDLGQRKGWWGDSGEQVSPGEWGVVRALQGEISVDEEVTIETAQGERKTLLNSATPLWGESGEIVGAVNLSEDVTAKNVAEAAQSRQQKQSHEAEKMEAVARLAGGIAHDFNNLLTGILSYSDLILQELRPADPIRADLEQIRDAGNRAANLTRQLLALSRRQLLQPRIVSLNVTIAELDPMLRRLLGPTVTLDTDLDLALGNVSVDPAQLEKVLENLIVNAREAMPGGGRVRISTANLYPVPEAGPRPQDVGTTGYVSLTVSDTGVGMDATTMARIFEPFFTTKQGMSGNGLGLSTVYGIVQQSGGQIRVDSTSGEGATFTIQFPRYSGPESAIGQSDRPAPQSGKETLLLVEDEAPVRESVRRLLEWHGYTVIEARNGADALRVFEDNENGIDLVLTDLTMPEMGGHELVERLRARRPGLRVLFMSGYTERTITSNGAVPGDTGIVEKPFTVETLMRRLREVLDS